MTGWIKLHRKLSEKAFYSKDSEMVHLWIHLLISANHMPREEYFAGKPIICNAGQFTIGRRQLEESTGINRSKIERILKKLADIEHQIEQQTSSSNRLITILHWDEYQQSEQQSEQQVSNNRATSEQQVSTLKEVKNKRIEESKEKEMSIFNDFRMIYPGTKKGNKTEFDNFIKKHKDWKEVLFTLKLKLESQISIKNIKKAKKQFVPQWKNLQTWINNRCWEEEISIEGNTEENTENLLAQ